MILLLFYIPEIDDFFGGVYKYMVLLFFYIPEIGDFFGGVYKIHEFVVLLYTGNR